ncbi:MAG: DUF839 domain-containing protein [Phycisphaerales bacterium]|nr:DUF839 domain-containing protein [Phycisphaerales bacterium]
MKCSAYALVLVAGLTGSAFAQNRGVSTNVDPYLRPVLPGIQTVSILTVGETAANGYQMIGVPDGLGAFNLANGTEFSLLMNHEIAATASTVREHGNRGSYVSNWNINRSTSGANAFRVSFGQDQTQAGGVSNWNTTLNGGAGGYEVPAAGSASLAFNRFCSGDLAPTSGLYNPLTGNGTQDRLYLTAEENRPPFGTYGRAYAFVATGAEARTQVQLPRFGRMSFENTVVNPYQNHDLTIAMALDDSSASTATNDPTNPPSEVYMYVGTRTNTGTAVDRAGLTNGNLHGMQVRVNNNIVTTESNANVFGTSSPVTSAQFSFTNFGNVSNDDGFGLQTQSIANDVFRMQRVEDGAWDTRAGQENNFYFVTTATASTQSRLWRMSYTDITNPTAGGTIEMLWQSSNPLNAASGLAGTSAVQSPNGVRMMDNMCLDQHGNIIITEDVGGNNVLGRVLLFNIASGQMSVIAQFDPASFATGGATFLTIDEESSGVIDAESILGQGWFLIDVQAHYANGSTLVEGGQLLAIQIPTPAGAALLGLAGVFASRRRRA